MSAPVLVPSHPPTQPTAAARANTLPTPRPLPPLALAGLILLAAAWGWIVDSRLLPILAPTSNSTIFQSTTAAAFALLGILFGPLVGALGGLVRDGTGYALAFALHPHHILRVGFGGWLGRAAVDTFEDVMLGWIPGLIARRTRRVGLLALTAAAAAWISLPFLIVGIAIFRGHVSQIWHVLTTPVGDWNEPVDPGLTVYALLTGGLVALALARWTSRPRISLLIGAAFLLPALLLIALGAHA